MLTSFVGYRVGVTVRAYPTMVRAHVFAEHTSRSGGFDVHARSVAPAVLDFVTGELFQIKLTPSYEHLRERRGTGPATPAPPARGRRGGRRPGRSPCGDRSVVRGSPLLGC